MIWSPTIAAVKTTAAAHFGLPVQALDARRKDQSLNRARMVAIKAASQLTDKSMVQIGKCFGGRDHSTILTAMRRFDQNAGKDGQLLADLEAITLKVSQGAGTRLRSGLQELADLIAPMVAKAVAAQLKIQTAPPPSITPPISPELQAAIDAVANASRDLDRARYTCLERAALTKLERTAALLRNCNQHSKETHHG